MAADLPIYSVVFGGMRNKISVIKYRLLQQPVFFCGNTANAKPMQKLRIFLFQLTGILYFPSRKRELMMCRFFILFLIANLLFHKSYSQVNDSVFTATSLQTFSLYNTNTNSSANIITGLHNKPVLLLFLSTECPLCQNYTTVLNSLYHQYNKQIIFYGIFPGKTVTAKEVEDFKLAYKISFPLLIDSTIQFSKYVQAAATPEAVLLNENYNLIYKGAIDNWLVTLGKKRVKPTENYLEDAISNNLNHAGITTKRTKAIGCKINDF